MLVGGFENVVQSMKWLGGVTMRDFYVMLLLFAFLVFRPGGIFGAKGGRLPRCGRSHGNASLPVCGSNVIGGRFSGVGDS